MNDVDAMIGQPQQCNHPHSTSLRGCQICKFDREKEAARQKWNAEKAKQDQLDRIEKMLIKLTNQL